MRRSDHEVTVVTLTRWPERNLDRAVASVQAQTVPVRHLVVVDGGGDAAGLRRRHPHLRVLEPRVAPNAFDYLPSRLGHLRNLAATYAQTEFVAYLDDDNAYQPEHLEALLSALREHPTVDVAHSWRRLLNVDGTEFPVDVIDPWDIKPWRRRRTFERCVRAGIYEPGSAIVRDALQRDGRWLARVDTSELVVRRRLHGRFPWPTEFAPPERARRLGEDSKLCHQLARASIPSVCSNRVSLDYYMGGYSNAHVLTGADPRDGSLLG